MTADTPAFRRFPLARTIVSLAIGASLLGSTAAAAPSGKASPTPTPRFTAAKPPVSIEKARAHKLRPAHTIGVGTADDGLPEATLKKTPKYFPKTPKLDAAKFSDAVHAAIKDKVRGYSLVVRRDTGLAAHVIWDYAKAPGDGNKGWTIDTRMHIASVSKMITAMAIIDLLDEQGLTVDTKIGPYIPDYWQVGNNVADLTFRDLMRHRSGFASDDSDGSFPAMKREVAKNVPANPDGHYANVNFSLLRVLGAVLSGTVSADTKWDDEINDAMWDIAATQWLIARANTHVLAPAGVAAFSPIPSGDAALAYSGKTDTQGWNSGDVSTQLGGVGFRLSPNDVAKIMGTWRRSGKIVSKELAEASVTGMLGINGDVDTNAGRGFYRKGGWGGTDIERSVAFYLPGKVEIVLMVNSHIANDPDFSMVELVTNAYNASLE